MVFGKLKCYVDILIPSSGDKRCLHCSFLAWQRYWSWLYGFQSLCWILLAEVMIYTLVLLTVGIQLSIKHRDPALLMGVPLAIVTMHFSWGSAFLWGMFKKA
jgi:hypothetical protein